MSMSCSNRNCQKQRKEIVEFLKEVNEKFERIERLFNETFAEIKKDASFIERILKQEEIFCDRNESSDASLSPPKRIRLSTTSANKDGCDSPLRRNIVTTEIIMSPNKQTDVNALPLLKGNSSNLEKDVGDHEYESNVSKCKNPCASARRKRQTPSLRQSTALRGSHCSPIVVMSPDKEAGAKAAPILKGKDLSDRQHEDEKIERVSCLHRRTEDISSEPNESKCKKSYSPRKRKKQALLLLQSTALHVSYCSPEQKSEDIIAFVQDEILKNNEIEIRAHVKYRNAERSAFKVTVPNGVSAEILKYQWPAPIKIQYWGKE